MNQVNNKVGCKLDTKELNDEAQALLSAIAGKKVLVVGDTIIDKYIFVKPKGRAIKDPILSTEYVREETYGGGAVAIAKHVSDFAGSVTFLTMLGESPSHLGFLSDDLPQNVRLEHILRPNSPTTVKTRYVDYYRNHKLFKMETIDDSPLPKSIEDQAYERLAGEMKSHDLTLVADFGHGLMTPRLRELVTQVPGFLALNVQTNSSNFGYNYLTGYSRADFATMNEEEARLPTNMRFEPIEQVARALSKASGIENLLITLGKKGSLYHERGNIHMAQALNLSPVDTVGAGDASFAIASLFASQGTRPLLVPLAANSAAAVKAGYMGNKEYVRKADLLKKLGEYHGLE